MKRYTRYWQNIVTLMILSVLVSFPLKASAAGATVYEQLPDHFGGFVSQFGEAVPDSQRIAVADDFQFDQPTLLDTITWWGSPRLLAADTFTIRLYADNGGQPGAILQSFDAPDNIVEIPTGDFVLPPDPKDDFEGVPEVQYSFDLPTAFLADAHTRYWFSVFSVPAIDEAAWLWEFSDDPIHHGVQRSFFQSDSGPWEPFDNIDPRIASVAFQLQGRAAPALTAGIDIKPGSFPNSINPRSYGKIPVAILSSSTFDAPRQVDTTSLTFGRTGDEQSLVRCSPYPEDVNGDGLLDLVCHFNTQTTGFQLGDIKGVLKGKTITGRSLIGTDSVRIMP